MSAGLLWLVAAAAPTPGLASPSRIGIATDRVTPLHGAVQPIPRIDPLAGALATRTARDALGRDLVRQVQRSARRGIAPALPAFHPLCELLPNGELAVAAAPADAACAARSTGVPLAAWGGRRVAR